MVDNLDKLNKEKDKLTKEHIGMNKLLNEERMKKSIRVKIVLRITFKRLEKINRSRIKICS